MKFASALCGAVLLAAPVLPAGTVPAGLLNSVTTPKEINADHFISSERNGDVFTLKSPSTELSVDAAGLGITVSRDGAEWSILPPEPFTVRLPDGTEKTVDCSAARSRRAEIQQFAGIRGVRITLSEFVADATPLDLTVRLFAGIDWPTGDVVFELRPDETKTALRRASWPGSIDGSKAEEAVIPHKQGLRIPRDWPKALDAPYGDADKFAFAYSHTLYMPWWGFSKNGKSAMMVLETPNDGGCYFRHTPESGTRITPKWVHSLGRMSYTRRARLKLLDGNYVQMAKAYRAAAIENGTFRSLKEKIAQTPSVAKLIGSPIVHTTALFTDMNRGTDWMITYAEHLKRLARLKSMGLEKLYVHLDGIGYRGYDNLEPDQLPVGAKPGGPAGLKSMIDYCHEQGWLFAYHQQYRDMYLDSPSCDRELLVRREDGTNHFETTWAGGRNGVLCSWLALDYVRRNNTFLADTGLAPDGCYLDVFAIVYGDECYHPEHRMNRTDCYEARRKCFDYIRDKFGIVSSEEPVDWAVRSLHLVHHAMWGVDGERNTFAQPVPLFNLVYHDALVTPFETGRKRGSYYYAKSEIPFLHALISAGMPYLDEEASAEDMEAAKIVAELHGRVGLLEMTNHEMLSPDGRRQRAAYGDGTVVTVDQETGDWEIAYPDKTVRGNAVNWKTN